MKNLSIKIIVPLIAIGILLNSCGIDNKEVYLAYKFDTGKKFHYVYDSHASYKAFENDNLVYAGDSTFKVAYVQETIENNDSAGARLRFTYTTNGKKNETESWATEYTMFPNGEITDLFDENDLSNESLEYYKKLLEQTSPMYPEEPVAEGFTWKHTVKVLLNEGTTDAATTYKVKAFVREAGFNCAVIEYKGNMIIPLSVDCSGANTTTHGQDRIEVEGVSYFAYAEGIVIKEEETSHLLREGIVTIDGADAAFKIEENRSYKSLLINIEE